MQCTFDRLNPLFLYNRPAFLFVSNVLLCAMFLIAFISEVLSQIVFSSLFAFLHVCFYRKKIDLGRTDTIEVDSHVDDNRTENDLITSLLFLYFFSSISSINIFTKNELLSFSLGSFSEDIYGWVEILRQSADNSKGK